MPDTAAFEDHFSDRAGEYASCRPRYPAGLFGWLASVAPACRLAMDVGAGSGQAALGSAAKRCREARGRDPLELLEPALAAAWGQERRRVRWPLHVRAGRG